jgi:hypothetical protein
MDLGTIERPPDGLSALYEGDFSKAPFTVDDVLAGGRSRQRRQQATLIGTSVTAALTVAAVALLASGALGGRAAPTLDPASPTPSASVTTAGAVFRPGCAPSPDSCRAAIAAWTRQYASSAAPVTLGSTTGYEKGTVVFEQLVSSVPGQRDVHLTVVVAPTQPVIDDGLDPFVGSGARSIPMTGTGEIVRGIEISLGGQYVSRWKTAALAGEHAHPAVQVGFNVANRGPAGSAFDGAADDVSPPTYWTDESLRILLTALIGDVGEPTGSVGRDERATTTTTAAATAPAPPADCTRTPLTCRAAYRSWTEANDLQIGNYGETTDGSYGGAARIFGAAPAADPYGLTSTTVVVTPTGGYTPDAGDRRTTIAGLPAWEQKPTHPDRTTRVITIAPDAGEHGGISLILDVAKGQPTPAAFGDASVESLVRGLYGLG